MGELSRSVFRDDLIPTMIRQESLDEALVDDVWQAFQEKEDILGAAINHAIIVICLALSRLRHLCLGFWCYGYYFFSKQVFTMTLIFMEEAEMKEEKSRET